MQEVARHKSADDAWMVLNGRVYNVTPYLNFHPGGADILVKAAGRDATALFRKCVRHVRASHTSWCHARARHCQRPAGMVTQASPPAVVTCRYHPWVNAHGLLAKCFLGPLAPPQPSKGA
jgi:cytochrome b involved in lipid metabolism